METVLDHVACFVWQGPCETEECGSGDEVAIENVFDYCGEAHAVNRVYLDLECTSRWMEVHLLSLLVSERATTSAVKRLCLWVQVVDP